MRRIDAEPVHARRQVHVQVKDVCDVCVDVFVVVHKDEHDVLLRSGHAGRFKTGYGEDIIVPSS